MPLDADVRRAASAYVSVLWHYDGLKGSVIRWTHEHGNKNEDPSVLAWILDPQGNEIANLSGQVYNASSLASALEERSKISFPLVDPAEYEVLGKQAKAIAARRKLGATVSELRTIAEGGDGVTEAEKGEAERLLAAISPHVDWKFERADELKASNPPAALALYRELAARFKGDEIGLRAMGILDALKKDDAFQAELKAYAALARARGAVESFKPCSGDRTLRLESCEDCRRRNGAALRDVVRLLKTIQKRWPDTTAADAAEDLLGEWGVR